MRALPNQLCPSCGQPNGCAPARTGDLGTQCWCARVVIDPAVLETIPEAERNQACLCSRCLTGARGERAPEHAAS